MNVDAKLIRPGWWYCLLIIPVAGVGFGLFSYLLWTGIQQSTNSLTQIVVPGEKDISLATRGLYTIFLEDQSVVDGRIYSTADGVSGLKCTVVSPNKENLSLSPTPLAVLIRMARAIRRP